MILQRIRGRAGMAAAAAALACGAALAAFTREPSRAVSPDEIYQVGVYIGLQNGLFDGTTTVGELKRHGDFGLGAMNRLNGEMVVVDGSAYRYDTTGAAVRVRDTDTVPFAIVTTRPGGSGRSLPAGLRFQAGASPFAGAVDALLPTVNWFYAVRVEGVFDSVVARTFPAQVQPYPPVSRLVPTQPTFHFGRVRGVMVGFREPSYVGSGSIPGYHLHFLTADGRGGHVLSFRTTSQTRLWTSQRPQFRMAVPQTRAFMQAPLDSVLK
jgi:acetolactate decarboxylase